MDDYLTRARQVHVHQDTLGRLLKTAQQLQVKGLIEQSGAGGGARAGEVVQVGSVSSGPAPLVTVVMLCLVLQITSEPAPAPGSSISAPAPLLLSPYHQLTPPPSVSPLSSASSLPSPGKTPAPPPIKIPSPPTPSYSWGRPLAGLLGGGGGGLPVKGAPLAAMFPNHQLPDMKTAQMTASNDIMDTEANNDNEDMKNEDESEDELVIEEPEEKGAATLKENVSPGSSRDLGTPPGDIRGEWRLVTVIWPPDTGADQDAVM